MTQLNKSAFRIAAMYFVLGAIYIYFSDSLLHITVPEDVAAHLYVSMGKGAAFVLVTAIVIYIAISRALRKLESANRFSRDTLNALSEHVAVLNEAGQILMVNEAWREFANANEVDVNTVCEGANYLMACQKAILVGNKDAEIIDAAIKEVASGERKSFSHEYACHSPTEKRYFIVTITRFSDYKPTRIVISHENITIRRLAEDKLVYLSAHDLLTRLPNRDGFLERLDEEIARATRFQNKFALITIDIDRFKMVNDAFGRALGDRILQEVAGRLSSVAREVDLVARHDGDQFLMLLRGIKGAADAARAASRVIEEVSSKPVVLDDAELSITVSIGIAIFPDHGMSFEQLMVNSDVALARIKSSGRNNFGFYSEDMNARSLELLTLEQHLRRAIGTNQLYAVFQPQFNLHKNELIGFEALARWRSPEFGDVSPGKFIPIAEESGLIIKIGEWMLHEACKQNADWVERGVSNVPVCVNVSALQFRQSNFVETVENALRVNQLSSSNLELELTESVVIDDTKILIEKLRKLDNLHVLLALDDFGTGYSSLSYLRSLPIRRLKVDKSFVRDLPHNKDSVAITGAIVGMGNNLGMRVIAEGVEFKEQAEFLKSIGCYEAQGYLYGKPMLPSEAELWMLGLQK